MLLLELKRERSNFRKLAALSLPIQETTWARDRDGNLACPTVVPWANATEISPLASVLQDPKEFPSTGQELEIQNLILSDPRELNALETRGDPWTIVFVQFKPTAFGERAKRDTIPVLALVRASDSGKESEKCVLYSFFIGITHNEGWVLLAPFAMAFDAVTLPIQLLALLWWFIVGE